MARLVTCFGMGATIPRVHICDMFSGVYELGEGGDGRWYKGELVGITQAPRPSHLFRDAITSFGVGGQVSRIYYFDDDGQVVEIGWGDDRRWYAAKIGAGAQAPAARQGSDIGQGGSDIACFGVDGGASRVYYFADDGSVIELAWQANSTWSWSNISAAIGAPAAHIDSNLACFAAGGWATRLYYFDADAQVIEIGWSREDDWYFFSAGQSAGAPPSGPGKALGCFGVDGTTPRVYYFTADGEAVELGIGEAQVWYAGILPIGETLAARTSQLTCFGVGGRDTRLYFFDVDNNLVEVGWGADGKWYSGTIDIPDPNNPGDAPIQLLASFGVEGRASAVYYATRNYGLIEMRFLGGAWVRTVRFETVQG